MMYDVDTNRSNALHLTIFSAPYINYFVSIARNTLQCIILFLLVKPIFIMEPLDLPHLLPPESCGRGRFIVQTYSRIETSLS